MQNPYAIERFITDHNADARVIAELHAQRRKATAGIWSGQWLEGVTFGLAYAVQALQRAGVEVEQVTLIGGGAASDAWAQTCADIFGVPVERPALPEAAGLGAALQARHVVDRAPLVPSAPAADRWEPSNPPGLTQAGEAHARMRTVAGVEV